MTLTRRPVLIPDPTAFHDSLERLFDDRFFRPFRIRPVEGEAVPALDLYTTAEAVIAKVALPGVKPDELDVRIAGDMVTISGDSTEEHEEQEAGYVYRELSRGRFNRTFTIPVSIQAEKATAAFKDGLLTLTLPRSEEVQPTSVKIDVG